MSVNAVNTYASDAHVAEIYDQVETQTHDVALIRRLIGGRGPLRILEPFCGTGRILIPLAMDGHELVGLDQARAMLDRARAKIERLPYGVQQRITLAEADVTASAWPDAFDVVILGGNCFYELATPEEQEGCIASAAKALKRGGHVYVDNDHMEGELDATWRRPGVSKAFPSGTCADGTGVEGASETIWFDAKARLVRFRRSVAVTYPDGQTLRSQWVQQKHPVSTWEVKGWLEAHGFAVVRHFGDQTGGPYTEDSGRAVFWARSSHALAQGRPSHSKGGDRR